MKLEQETCLISVIVPLFNTEKYIRRCIESIVRQTWGNLEIIVVNDASTDRSGDIVKEMMRTDPRIRLVSHDENRGLFHARITGVEHARGDYIGFVDSDDYVSMDFFRTLAYQAVSMDADIVIGRLVHEDAKGYRYIHNLYQFYEFGTLRGKEIAEAYWKQEGRCFIWHTVWNKIYRRELWQKALPVLKRQEKHLIMTEDFVFSSVLVHFAESLSYVKYGAYFYFQNESASTSLTGGKKKFQKNISDLHTAFSFVEDFLSSGNYRIEASEQFFAWRRLYKFFWTENIANSGLPEEETQPLYALLEQSLEGGADVENPSYFYAVSTEYDNRYDELAEKVCREETRCVSFDIFDTALLRPFYHPKDLFRMLDRRFAEAFPEERRTFAQIRVKAEEELREEKISGRASHGGTGHAGLQEEIGIREIYRKISEYTGMDAEQSKAWMREEMLAEKRFCKARESLQNLYRAARHCGKRLYFTSDMYFGRAFLEELLKENGYEDFEEVLVSSEENATKRTGTLYAALMRRSGCRGEEILHIGDNWETDILSARNYRIEACFYPRAVDCIQYNISDIKTTHSCGPYKEAGGSIVNYEKALGFLGTRSALAVAANRLYDNPFISFHEWSEMNASPQFLGYYAVGMHLLGFTKWLAEAAGAGGYDTLAFTARDGWLPLEAYRVFQEYLKGLPEAGYFYTSRKAGAACGLQTEDGISALWPCINAKSCTPEAFIGMLAPVLEECGAEFYQEHGIRPEEPFSTYTEFCRVGKILAEKKFSREKAERYRACVKAYLEPLLRGKAAVVDIGYSGRTQELLTGLLGKEIDAFYVHVNDDSCAERESRCGFQTETFYGFTPAITGGIRELLFSCYAPSCIGYEIRGDQAVPVFEPFAREYVMEYLIGQIQEYALLFVKDFCRFFGEDLERMEMRNMDVSYPYEYFLHTLTEADSKMFECCSFEDDLWMGKRFGLSEQWKADIAYHKIVPYYQVGEAALQQIPPADSLAWQLYHMKGMESRKLWKKLLYWFLVDRDFFWKRVREYAGRGSKS